MDCFFFAEKFIWFSIINNKRLNENPMQETWSNFPNRRRMVMQKLVRKTKRIILILTCMPVVFIIDLQHVLVNWKSLLFYSGKSIHLGVRNLFDSSFMLSGNWSEDCSKKLSALSLSLGEQWDDGNVRKTTRVQQPPGGQSKGRVRSIRHFFLHLIFIF